MRTVEKTTKKVVIEVTMEEIYKKGFESLWDDVRSIYPFSEYEIVSVEEIPNRMIVIVELKSSKKY